MHFQNLFRAGLFLALICPALTMAQLNPDVIPSKDEFQSSLPIPLLLKRIPDRLATWKSANGLPNIVLIGYWPPTNEMVREFSSNPTQNPAGWVGENWEGRGYNVYSFFPEFPNGLGIGEGDFQVDYQSTSRDFWAIVPALKPVAVLSFGRAHANKDWEIELVARNSTTWIDDYQAPRLPTPNPPDPSFGVMASHPSPFPSAAIISALQAEVPSLVPYADNKGAGLYLCEYLGFHLSWYQAQNPQQVRYAAHTHIGSESPLVDLKTAVKVSLRALIRSLDGK